MHRPAALRAFIATALALTAIAAGCQPGEAPAAAPPIDVTAWELNSRYRVMGMLHRPLGTVVVVKGVVVEGRGKGDRGRPFLRVHRIDGVATRELIDLPLSPFWADPEDPNWNADHGERLRELDTGASYELKGWGKGGFSGIPFNDHHGDIPGMQSRGFGWVEGFQVYKARRIDAAPFGPADFVGRSALLGGTAASDGGRAYIQGRGWRLLTDATSAWAADMEGKEVEGLGVVRAGDAPGRAGDAAGVFTLEQGATRLVRLEDQVGRAVELRGTAWSMNGEWWLEYRGVDLHVENMKGLVPDGSHLHARPVVVRGTLGEAVLPPPDGRSYGPDGFPRKRFVVRGASLRPLDGLRSPELVEPLER